MQKSKLGGSAALTQSRTKASERAFSAVADNGDTHRKEFGYGKRKRLKFRYDKLWSPAPGGTEYLHFDIRFLTFCISITRCHINPLPETCLKRVKTGQKLPFAIIHRYLRRATRTGAHDHFFPSVFINVGRRHRDAAAE